MTLDLPATIARVQSAPTPTVAFRRGEAIELCRLAQRPYWPELPFCVAELERLRREAVKHGGAPVMIGAPMLLVLVEFALGCAGETS